jgi:hypothetical protein
MNHYENVPGTTLMAMRFVRVSGILYSGSMLVTTVLFLALWQWESEAIRLFSDIDSVSVVN